MTKKRRSVLFEFLGGSGQTIANTFRDFPEDTPDEVIQAELDEWVEEQKSNVSSNWSDWGN